MKKNLCLARSVLALSVLALAFICQTSFAQDNSLLSHISPEVQTIYLVNFKSIFAKVSWADMMARIPDHAGKSSGMDGMELLKDPALAGIDIGKDILITMSDKDPADSNSYTTVVLHLTDSSKFRIFLRKQYEGAAITTYRDKSHSLARSKLAVAWNNEFAVIEQASSKKIVEEGATAHYKKLIVLKSLDALKGFAGTMYTGDPVLKAAFADDADIHICSFSGNSFKALGKMMGKKGFGGLNLDSMAMFKRTLSEIRFENGRILMSSSTLLDPRMADDLKKFAPPPYNPDLIARIPKGNLLGLVGMRTDLSFLGYMLGKIGFRAKMDSALSPNGLSVDGISHAFKGDILIAAVDPPHTDSSAKPKPIVYFATTINDVSVLQKLVVMLGKKKDPAGAGVASKADMLSKMKDHFAIKDNILVISGSKELAEGYLANPEKRSTDFMTDRMKQDPFYIWIDLNTIVNLVLGPAGSAEPTDKKMKMMNGLHVLDKIIITGGSLDDGQIDGYMELRLMDQQQNALKTLLDIIPVK